MKKLFLVLAAACLLSAAAAQPAIAADNGTVDATVTTVLVSMTVSPTSVAYGTQPLNATGVIPNPDRFTVTNNGNVFEDFTIKGANTAAWQLNSTAGSDLYVHRFKFGLNGSFSPLTTLPTSLAAGVNGNGGNFEVFLNMDLPTTSSSSLQQTASVTVMATEHTGP